MKTRTYLGWLLTSVVLLSGCRSTKQHVSEIAGHLTAAGAIAGCGSPTRDEIIPGSYEFRDLTYDRNDGAWGSLRFVHLTDRRIWVFDSVSEGRGPSSNTYRESDIADNLLRIFPCLTSAATAGSWPQPDTPPTIRLFQPQANGTNITINGEARATTTGADISSISWSFGDGTSAPNATFPVVHNYPHSGAFSLTAVATDSFGLTQSAQTTVTVGGATPASSLLLIKLFDPELNGLSASFNGVTQPTAPGVTIASITWDFGDGVAGINAWFPVSHNYSLPGTYRVTAVATDNSDNEQSASVTVTTKDWLQK